MSSSTPACEPVRGTLPPNFFAYEANVTDKNDFNDDSSSSRKLPRGGSLPSPLTAILGHEADPDNLTAAEMKTLRTHAAGRLPMRLAPRELDDFAAEMFRNTEILAAYFRPAPVREMHGRRASFRLVLPFDCAIRAAKTAARAACLLAHEHDLAWVAALAYPCGMFVAADPSLRPATDVRRISDADTTVALRHMLLRDPMRSLRSRNHVLASTLAAALDVGGQEDECDLQQVARLVTAVRMSMTTIQRAWRGW